jgi:hypothetical protein
VLWPHLRALAHDVLRAAPYPAGMTQLEYVDPSEAGRPLNLVLIYLISKKSPGRCRGFQIRFRIKSVPRDPWSAELVVQARGEEIDVLLDMVGDEEAGG